MNGHNSFRKYLSFLLLILTLVVKAQTCFAQTKAQKLDNLITTCYENGQFNGVVFLAEHGNIIYQKALGIANYKTKEQLSLDSQFRLASVSKQFTAMAIMMLKEEDKLTYEDDIRKHIPELPYGFITIRNLLNHTSGLPDYVTMFNKHWEKTQENSSAKKVAANNDAIELLAKHKPTVHFTPGDRWEYSNTGYVILASIVERVSGEEFDNFLKLHVFSPLKMTRTLVYSPIHDQQMEDRVYGYRLALDGSSTTPNDHHYLNGIAGDGGIYSTIGDLFKWDQALYTEKLVNRSTLEEAFQPVTLNNDSTHNYGFGWGIGETKAGKKRVSHSGGWVGFRTYIHREIEDRNTFIILTNHSSSYLNSIRQEILNILHDREYTIPKISIAGILAKTLRNEGLDRAIHQYHHLKVEEIDKYNFAERELNTLGYHYLQNNSFDIAITIFKLNVEVYPEAYNVYDSLGEAYMKAGKLELAIKNYQKSVELNPDNTNAVDMLKKLKVE